MLHTPSLATMWPGSSKGTLITPSRVNWNKPSDGKKPACLTLVRHGRQQWLHTTHGCIWVWCMTLPIDPLVKCRQDCMIFPSIPLTAQRTPMQHLTTSPEDPLSWISHNNHDLKKPYMHYVWVHLNRGHVCRGPRYTKQPITTPLSTPSRHADDSTTYTMTLLIASWQTFAGPPSQNQSKSYQVTSVPLPIASTDWFQSFDYPSFHFNHSAIRWT